MSAVWLRIRSEFRTRWRAWFGLALLMGSFGGAIVAAAAGARRTDTAYERFLEAQKAYDSIVPLGFIDPCCAALTMEQVRSASGVEEVIPMTAFFVGDSGLIASPDSRFGRSLNEFKVLKGRLPNPHAADEVFVSLDLAQTKKWRVGTVLNVPFHRVEGPEASVTLRIVGIGAAPGDFPPYAGIPPSPYGTPAFYEKYLPFARHGDNAFNAAVVFLKRGDADLDAFHSDLGRLGGGKVIAFTDDQRDKTRNITRSFGLQAAALWLVAAMAAVAALLIFSQALTRETFLEATEYPTLRTVGMTEADLVKLGLLRAAATAAIAAVIAVVIAVALSAVLPTGLPRVAEPDPGVAFDAVAIGAGVAAILVLVTALAIVPARRSARLSSSRLGVAELSAARPSGTVAAMARAGLPPSVVSGVRLALEPGHGRTAVPVRSTIAGVTLGIAALATAVSFSASLTHLLRTPRLYGQNWDASFGGGNLRAGFAERLILPRLRGDPRVEALGVGTLALPLDIERLRLQAVVIDDIKGTVTPEARTGRAPRTDNEILLGERTLATLRKKVGDPIEVSVQGTGARGAMTIVGTGIIPPVGATARFGEGAAIRYGALPALCRCDVPPPDTVVVRFSPGVQKGPTINELRDEFRGLRDLEGMDVTRPERPTDLVNFGRVQSFPLILAGLLGALAAAVLAHALISVIRRRGRDLAILKTLGFVRRQVRGTVAWQATCLAAISLAVGLPLGVALGRSLWTIFADQVGVVPAPRIPTGTLLLAIPAGLAFANIIAARPARNAANLRPAVALRTE